MNNINDKLIKLLDVVAHTITIMIFIISIPLTIIIAFILAVLIVGAMMAVTVGLLYLIAHI